MGLPGFCTRLCIESTTVLATSTWCRSAVNPRRKVAGVSIPSVPAVAAGTHFGVVTTEQLQIFSVACSVVSDVMSAILDCVFYFVSPAMREGPMLSSLFNGFSANPRRRRFRSNLAVDVAILERRQLLTAPSEPVVITGVEFDGDITVRWDAVSDATEYDVWISKASFRSEAILSSVIVDTPSISRNNMPASYDSLLDVGSNAGGRFRVWVRAKNEDGFGPWGPGFTYVVPGNRSDRAQWATSAQYTSGSRLDLQWDSLIPQGALTHEIWVSHDGQRVINTETADAAWQSDTLASGAYQVWVRGKTDRYSGPWSEVRIFAVGASQPQLTGPVSTAAPNRPEFTWSSGVNGTPYQLWVQKDNGGVVINQKNITGTSFTPDSDMADGVYSAWIRQVDDAGRALPWSSRYRFEIVHSVLPGTPVLSMTENRLGDNVADRRAILQWTATENTASYELWISDRHSGTRVLLVSDLTGTSIITEPLDGWLRAWVRAVSVVGDTSPWSDPIDFDVIADTGEVLDPTGPTRWEPNIQEFEQKIVNGTSKPGSILFIGSSSIVNWDVERWFPQHTIVNHGFGGSQVSDSVYYFDRAVTPLEPAMVVMYAGDNDIAKGKTAEDVHRDFTAFAAKVKAKLAAGTKLAYIAIKPSTTRWDLSGEMAKANALIANDCAADDQLEFIDIWTPMLTGDGPPPDKWFIGDGLHLSEEGYQLWTDIVRGYLPDDE